MSSPLPHEYLLIPLHTHLEYLEPLINLLNSQWPQSRTIRLRTLEKSNDALPIALVFLESSNSSSSPSQVSSTKNLIGHSYLCSIPDQPRQVWIQSVVINRELRGRGLGRRLMLATEQYARDKYSAEISYLSTHDKREFYEKLGYEICPPILNVGSNSSLFKDERFRKFAQQTFGNSTTNSSSEGEGSTGNMDRSVEVMEKSTISSVSTISMPAPPPAPPLPKSTLLSPREPEMVFMKKRLV